MEEDLGGIDKEHGHPRALQIIPDEFFWDCTDELAPFGSDEGDTALHEYREWRKHHPGEPLEDCIVWTIESVGEMEVSECSDAIFNESTVREQIEDPDFDDQQYRPARRAAAGIFTTDVSVLATAFGQLADEGTIDASAKPYVARALKRQAVWARLQPDWACTEEYLHKLSRLQAALDVA